MATRFHCLRRGCGFPAARYATRPGRVAVRPLAATQGSKDHRRAAAEKAVDEFVKGGAVVGLGSGEMVVMAIQHIGSKLANRQLEGVTCVPCSSLAAHEAAFHGVPLSNLEEHPQVGVYLEEADQVDVAGGAFLKGIRAQPQQPELPRQKEMAAAAQHLVLLADGNNMVPRLNASLPIFIDANTWEETAEGIDDTFLGDAEIWRRPTSGVANPRGGDRPYLSPEGCHVVDVRFYEGLKLFGEDAEYEKIAAEIEGIPGVVAQGLLQLLTEGKDTHLVVAERDGAVRVLDRAAVQAAGAAAADAVAAAAGSGDSGSSKEQPEP